MPSLNVQILVAACLGLLLGWLTGALPEDAALREGTLYAAGLVSSVFAGYDQIATETRPWNLDEAKE